MGWTDEMIEQLTQLWMSGLTTNEIAKELGLSKNSVVGKVHRMNLNSRPSPIKKKEEAQVEQSAVQEPKQVKSPKKTTPSLEHKPAKIAVSPIDTKTHSDTCVKLSDLNSHTCRWPIGDPKDENFCFCGKKVRAGQTYCDEHAAIAYVKPIKK